MPKNVVLCCDGTANEFAQDRTNVIKLFSTLEQDPARQVAYYHPGLGTMESPAALSGFSRRMTRFLGNAVGYGLDLDIRDAYVFLMNNYDEGDKVFLFGFSRGAYTVRAVAALLHMYGLIPRGNEPFVPYAIRLLMAIHKIDNKRGDQTEEEQRYFKLARDFKNTFATRVCKPWFVGVWDTVSSIGWYENPLHLPYTVDNPDIEIGRHAISIDERRAFFRTNLWMPKPPPTPTGPKDLKQVWFPGVHCDVGGGYSEEESGLSKIALEWMLKEAEDAELLVDLVKRDTMLGRADGDYVQPNPAAIIHQSLKGWWWLAEYIWKRHYNWKKKKWEHYLNRGRPRTIPPGSVIHQSVFTRIAADASYQPANLPKEPAENLSPTSAVAPTITNQSKYKLLWLFRGIKWAGIALVLAGLLAIVIETVSWLRCALLLVAIGAALRGLATIGFQRIEK